MSMLSAQIDRLRELATRYDELQVGAVKAITMPSDMGSILRDAADTICELRGALQVASVDYRHLADENAKLRELCASLYEFAMSEYPDGTELNFADRIRELGVEV